MGVMETSQENSVGDEIEETGAEVNVEYLACRNMMINGRRQSDFNFRLLDFSVPT